MTNLRVFTDKGLDFIHQNMSDFFETMKINRTDSSWIKDFCKKDPTTPSPYSFDFSFETNSLNPNEGEFNNATRLYELFKSNRVGRAVIYNEKFAAGFLLTYGYKYFVWSSDLAAETRVSATLFFDNRKGLRQALARQLMTRLYKVVELTVDTDLEDKYELTRFVFDNPALRRIVYYPNMDCEKVSRSFVRAFKEWKETDASRTITKNIFEKARLSFSAYSHVNMLESMDEKELTTRLSNSIFKDLD